MSDSDQGYVDPGDNAIVLQITTPIISTGLSVQYGLGVYDVHGYTPIPYIRHESNKTRRDPADNVFQWEPARPIEWSLSTGNYTGTYEIINAEEYEIAISPDLGWAEPSKLLEEYSPSSPIQSNTRVFKKRNLSIDNNSLSYDEENRTLILALSEADLSSLYITKHKDYFWSVRAYNQYGIPSKWAEPRRYEVLFEVSSNAVTLEPIQRKNDVAITLSGKKNSLINKVEINGSTIHTTYPNRESWIAEVQVTGGINKFFIKGVPITGNPTSYIVLDVDIQTGANSVQPIFNTFDEFGILHGVDRLNSIQENNQSYKNRIIDVFNHPANSNLLGLHHSIARNLNLDYDDNALIIRPAIIDGYNRSDKHYPNLKLEVDTNYIYLTSPSFLVYNEHHIIDPGCLSIELNNKPLLNDETSISIYSPPGILVSNFDWEYNIEYNKVIFNNESYKYKNVWITYPKKLPVAIGPTIYLNQLAANMRLLEYDGRPLLEVTVSSARNGTESSDGLIRGIFNLRSSTRYFDDDNLVQFGLRLRWTNMSIHRLVDPEFMYRYIDSNNQLLGTKIEAFVNQFKNLAHHTWSNTVLGKDIWDAIDPITENSARIDNVLDSIMGYWISVSKKFTQERYTSTQAFDIGYVNNVDKTTLRFIGIPQEKIKSGIGRDKDLKVIIKKDIVDNEVLTNPDVYRETLTFTIQGQIDDSKYLPATVFGGLLFRP